MPKSTIPLLRQPDTQKVVQKICDAHGIKFPQFEELVDLQTQQLGRGRRHGMDDHLGDILDRIMHEEN